MQTKIKDEPVLFIHVKSPNAQGHNPEGFWHVQASVSRMARLEDGLGENMSDFPYYSPEVVSGLYVRDLMLTSQGHKESPKLYGFGFRYEQVHSVERRDAEIMGKTLKTLERKMDKLHENFGYTESFAEHILRFAQVIKAVRIVFRTPFVAANRDQEWHYRSLSDMKICRWTIDDMIRTLTNAYGAS